jgi:hypothetical protein
MMATVYLRPVTALLFVAATLLAALTPAAPCLLWVLLIVPLGLFTAATPSLLLLVCDQQLEKPQTLAFPVSSPRPPPVL